MKKMSQNVLSSKCKLFSRKIIHNIKEYEMKPDISAPNFKRKSFTIEYLIE